MSWAMGMNEVKLRKESMIESGESTARNISKDFREKQGDSTVKTHWTLSPTEFAIILHVSYV